MDQLISKKKFKELVTSRKFIELFNELGWDFAELTIPVIAGDNHYELNAVAEKRDFIVLNCTGKNGGFPDKTERKRIERNIAKKFYEHLIIFTGEKVIKQVWQLAIREPNKPIVIREVEYYTNQEPEYLYQKLAGLFFSIDEEENIGIADVKLRVTEQFNQNAEKVTKAFYDRFKKEHAIFLSFIEGIENKVNKDWYASLMLNRLMFIYFIQRKGFLDKNHNYLSDKLHETQKKHGKDEFYSFYKKFLLVLFHEGLGSPERNEQLEDELGRIPYLDGGLFDIHDLEKEHDIQIRDDAFKKIFEFFDDFNWHLDTTITATGKDINPDVIGYIFEKYINDRAAMGAYYTKEDITEYISKNTVIPFLFDQVKKECANAFRNDSSLWSMLREDPDRYIYPAVQYGIYDLDPGTGEKKYKDYPEEIAMGLDIQKPGLLERRKAWNKYAPEDVALPTEIWREVIERRNRYFEVKKKLENDEIREINDFITYNLNIRQFAQDAVEHYEGSDFINAFYKAISRLTILDPTCGSGAFLFAALNILEPLYETCINRMRDFVNEADEKGQAKKHSNFREVLMEMDKHPGDKYYIYKKIILNNLYGVDIMREAVEIAKLRFFLKLVATVDADYRKPNLGLEPLPDIDFNIRAGNTLVGFATEKELEKCLVEDMMGAIVKEEIEEKCDIVARTFARYKEIQLSSGNDYHDFKVAKEELIKRLKELNHELNLLLHKQASGLKYDNWLASHQPFHWFAQFYEIIHNKGGFDVIIGNPPYVECSKIKYTLDKFQTLKSGNLYALVIENCASLLKKKGYIGLIVQNSIVCTKRMLPIQQFLENRFSLFFSNFDDRPAKLFTGIYHMKGTIFLGVPICGSKFIFTTKFFRWYEEYRPSVFDILKYNELNKRLNFPGHFSKYSEKRHQQILLKIYKQKSLGLSLKNSGEVVYCHRIASYFIKAINFVPYFYNEKQGEKKSDDYKKYYVDSENKKMMLMALFNSSIFYINWHTLHDGYHCGKKNIDEYPFIFQNENHELSKKMIKLGSSVSNDYKQNSFRKDTFYKNTGKVIYDEFYPKKSKPIIDEIDTVLAEHYGFTQEELDFIINYDIKYRMGKELEKGGSNN
ncbi:MAG: Eco57I restriction-modification methylase domain-containing protein [Bacteroidales bacterium]|nr:Eco57I restriction-modification methylase domain-containing protein [Bacteroidales bacterium]